MYVEQQTPSEMLNEMRRRHASGSFVEIVPPLTALSNLFRIANTTDTNTTAAATAATGKFRAKANPLAHALGFSTDTGRKQRKQNANRTLRFRRQVGNYPVNTDIFLTLTGS